ncbi:hypothetical protein [Mucilaginibacter sp. OK098]|uniref:hypothetical protein n=1 Tax=Mucilaginibacter sp. OK098 TaxID=1855297 RepID=UPI0009142CCA|nr:hypothetical protein [Mucilaginibacter sp. OK098]SHM46370.1 hypothetical protein SAMN05216524_102191 [Mucilaginibacter sp. OK098]
MKKPQLNAPQPETKVALTREQMKNVRGGYALPPNGGVDDAATYNMCCWDNQPSNCSYCAVGTVCQANSHLVACSTY